jgi:hypothetical protein
VSAAHRREIKVEVRLHSVVMGFTLFGSRGSLFDPEGIASVVRIRTLVHPGGRAR